MAKYLLLEVEKIELLRKYLEGINVEADSISEKIAAKSMLEGINNIVGSCAMSEGESEAVFRSVYNAGYRLIGVTGKDSKPSFFDEYKEHNL